MVGRLGRSLRSAGINIAAVLVIAGVIMIETVVQILILLRRNRGRIGLVIRCGRHGLIRILIYTVCTRLYRLLVIHTISIGIDIGLLFLHFFLHRLRIGCVIAFGRVLRRVMQQLCLFVLGKLNIFV